MNTDWRTIQVVPAPKHGNVEVFERTGEMPGEYTSTSLLRLFGVLLQQHANKPLSTSPSIGDASSFQS